MCYLVILINLMEMWHVIKLGSKIRQKVNSINPTAMRTVKDVQKHFIKNIGLESKKEIWKRKKKSSHKGEYQHQSLKRADNWDL